MNPFKSNPILQFVILTIFMQNLKYIFGGIGSTKNVQDFTDENFRRVEQLNSTYTNKERRSKSNTDKISKATTDMVTMKPFTEESFTVNTFTIDSGLDVDDRIGRDPCSFFGGCNRMSSELVLPVAKYCHCDADCVIYNDCCIDFHRDHHQSLNSSYTECVPVQSGEFGTEFFGIYVIAKCPESYLDLNTKNNCMQGLVKVGPYVADRNGTVYKNRYCAMCHGTSDYQHFKVQLSNINDNLISLKHENLTQMERLALYLSHPDTRYVFIPPNGTVTRSCAVYENFSDDETTECKEYGVNPIIIANKDNSVIHLYRNAFCNNMDNISPMFCYGFRISLLVKHEIFALTAMFSFSSNSKKICQNGEDLVNDLCVAQPMITDYKQDVYLEMISSESLDLKFIEQVLFGLMSSVNVDEKVFVRSLKCVNESYSGNSTLLFIHMTIFVFSHMSSNELVHLKMQLGHFMWKSVIGSYNKSIAVLVRHVKEDYIWVEMAVIFSYSFIKVNRANLNELEKEFVKDMNSKYVFKNSSNFMCFDMSVKMVKADRNLFIEEIACVNEGKSHTFIYINKLQSILTYVGNSLSIFALFISIIISRKLKMSHSIPGNNLENLSISLALSNLFFMVGIGANDYQRVCYAFGIVLHYLWLVSFSFMTIAVSFVCCNLFSMTSNNSDKTSSKRIKHTLTCIGLLLPLIFVIPAVVLDILDFPMFEALYAGTICFPTGFLTNLVFVSGPITLCIFVNFIALCFVVIYITRHGLKMSHVRKSQAYSQGVIYFRICALAGITWIFAIIGSFVQSIYVDFIAIALCSLQGLAVAFANLTTKRICMSVRHKGEKRSINNSKSTYL